MPVHHSVLFGGGLDSCGVALYLSKFRPELIHVHYGQKAAIAERNVTQYWADKLKSKAKFLSIDLSFSKALIMYGAGVANNRENNRLELRNPVLITLAASYLASTYNESVLYLGFHVEPEGSGFADAKTDYLYYMNEMIQLATNNKVRVEAPLATYTRYEILKMAHFLDPEVLSHTHTCYESEECSVCTHCIEKKALIEKLFGETVA